MATSVFVQESIRSSSSTLHSQPESSSSPSSLRWGQRGWASPLPPEGPWLSLSSWLSDTPLVLASDMQVINAIHCNDKQ